MTAPTQAVQVYNPAAAMEHAQNLAKSTLVSQHFRNAHNVLFAAELGRSFGLEAAVAVKNIHVFDSGEGPKTAISADLMIKLARDAGHTVHIESTPTRVIGTLIRGDFTKERIEYLSAVGYSPEEIRKLTTFTEMWDEKRAAQAGVINKNNWKTYKEDMMRARVKSGLVRLGAPEVLLGAQYTADELGAETDRMGIPLEDGYTIVGETVPNRPREKVTVTRISEPAPTPATSVTETEIQDAEIQETTEGPDAQAVADYVTTVLEDTDLSMADKMETIEKTLGNVVTCGMEDATVTGRAGNMGLKDFVLSLVDAQAIAEHGVEIVNDTAMKSMDKIKAIHILTTKVALFDMNDSKIVMGDEPPGPLGEFLLQLGRLLMAQQKAAARKKTTG